MENEEGKRQRRSGNRFDEDDEMQKSIKRNPGILLALDAVHRSLLNNNLKYEAKTVGDTCTSDDDEYEYFSSKSSIASSDENSGDNKISLNDWCRPTKNRNVDRMPTKQRQNRHEHVHALVHKSGQMHECIGEPAKYGADELHANRSRYFNCHMKNEPKNHRQIGAQHNVESSSRQCTSNGSAMHEENRCCSKAGDQRVAEHGTKENRIMKSEHAQQPQPQKERCIVCNCVKASSNDDTDDVTSSENRDSDTNLLIENLRNRECEMFQKICFNNGYYGSSGTTSNYTSDTNSAISMELPQNGNKSLEKCSECANLSEKNMCRRQRSSSGGGQQQQHVANTIMSKSKKSKQSYRKHSVSGSDRQSNVSEQSRRITITIKTKTVSDAATTTTATANTKDRLTDRNVHFFNDSETEDSGDTTESECTTVNGSAKAIADTAFDATGNCGIFADEETNVKSDEDNCCHDDDDDDGNEEDIEQSKSESSVFLSIQSEQSQYFDCVNESTSLSGEARQSTSESETKMRSRDYTKSESKTKRNDSPMICITQEMARDRTVTSQVQINREKVRAFRKKQKESKRPKIIDDSFCEEILNETLKLPSFVDAKRTSVGKTVSVGSDGVRVVSNTTAKTNNFISERFSMGNLAASASPKYTGKSIGRLLAQRLEQQTMTRVRRTMLQQTGIELAIADDKYVARRKKLEQLPPIKPPRSFAASSSSSPHSKESVESSATVPIEELKRVDPSYIGWMASTSSNEPQSKPRTHIGWVRPEENVKNESRASHQNSLHFYTAEGETGLATKEDIDTVDFASYASAAQEFESFSANLDDNGGRMNLSTPIKSKSPERSDQFTTANGFDGSVLVVEAATEPIAIEKRCTKCHGMKKKSSSILSTKNGRKIGKAALKRTKTFIDSSKQFLMKSKKNKNEKVCIHAGHTGCNAGAVETPAKDPDNTARLNSETFYSCETEKRTDKSLNLTTPQKRQPRPSAPPAAELNPSPDRNVRRTDANLLRTMPQSSPTPYATPNASFNFDRVVEPPKPVPNIKSTGKSSPSKLISKLNQIAKNSKILFRHKEPVQAKATAMAEVPHYYRSFGDNQIDASVPLMGETLRNLREKLEIDRRPVPAARKSLFTKEVLDQSLNTERVAEIELHDEPEPIYARIEIQPSEKTTEEDDKPSSTEREPRPRSAVRVDEVFVTTREGMPPSKYLMINNDPKTLYATVNRNAPTTTTETKSADSVARLESCSSYESLDMSSIGEFAQSLQQIMDENQLRMRQIYRTMSESGDDDDAAVDDLSSGCSSFYRKSREIVETETESKRWQDFMESLSLGTVQTGSYCESIGRGNDVNDEIKKSIGLVEQTANTSARLSHSDGFSYDCEDEELMQTARMDDSDRVKSFNRTSDYQTPSSGCTSSTNSSPKGSKGNSPNFKLIKNKVRESFRKSKNYLRSGSKRWSGRLMDTNRSAVDTSNDNSFGSARPCSSICNYPKSHDEKLYKTIHATLLGLPDGALTTKEKKLLKLDERILHHQSIRHELSDALEMCRATKEFQNSPELIESERLILVSNLKELAAKEELTRLWQIDSDDVATTAANGRCILSIVYAEFALKEDAIYDTHFNYFYVCVLSHRDTIECSSVKERVGNRVIFNDLQVQFTDLRSSFEVRVEMFVLRLRKNQRHSSSSKNTDSLGTGNSTASRFRFHGRTTLTSCDLSQNKRKQFPAQRNLRKNEQNGSMVFTMYDIVKMDMQLHGDMNNLNGDALIGFQNEIAFGAIEHCGFVDIAQKKWKWDRLWCRIDGFRINFWAYPQDATNSVPLLTLDLQQCTSTGGNLTVCRRETCAKARSFKLDFRSTSPSDTGSEHTMSFFIAAETQNDLDNWLKAINRILDLMNDWSI